MGCIDNESLAFIRDEHGSLNLFLHADIREHDPAALFFIIEDCFNAYGFLAESILVKHVKFYFAIVWFFVAEHSFQHCSERRPV